jgi:3-(3-hydroxy-phenyl)propionate hydroxylase
MCSGLRDAANLAWKLAAVKGGTDASLLDHYQAEREPNVRGIIALAMMMGRTVCITDPAAARMRDEQMLAARAAGNSPDASAVQPLLAGGICEGAAAAGVYFFQTIAGGVRLDDVIGAGPWLIARHAVPRQLAGLTHISLADTRLAPFSDELASWLDAHAAEAVIVRPDRYAFGAGEANALQDAWSRLLS